VDLAFFVVIDRQRASVGHLPEQDWSLRVTLFYREERTASGSLRTCMRT
jgi:hypothetical protein